MAKNRKKLYSNETFTVRQLPHNRRQVFGDVLKLHYFEFIKIGLILFAFSIPLFLVAFFKDYSYIVAKQNEISNMPIYLICCAVEVVAIIFLAIPISGLGKILREYAWLEPVFFKDDFKSGIKENIKPTLISAVVIGLLTFVFDLIFYFYDYGFIAAIPFGFNVFVFFPILMHTIFINFTYTNKYTVNLKLGMYFYFKHLPTTILSILGIVVFKVYDLFQFANIIAILTKYLVLLVWVIFIIPIILLAVQINELRIFDLRINSIRFPHLVNKGIYVIDEEELEAERAEKQKAKKKKTASKKVN